MRNQLDVSKIMISQETLIQWEKTKQKAVQRLSDDGFSLEGDIVKNPEFELLNGYLYIFARTIKGTELCQMKIEHDHWYTNDNINNLH